jgi:hypothetical protein
VPKAAAVVAKEVGTYQPQLQRLQVEARTVYDKMTKITQSVVNYYASHVRPHFRPGEEEALVAIYCAKGPIGAAASDDAHPAASKAYAARLRSSQPALCAVSLDAQRVIDQIIASGEDAHGDELFPEVSAEESDEELPDV